MSGGYYDYLFLQLSEGQIISGHTMECLQCMIDEMEEDPELKEILRNAMTEIKEMEERLKTLFNSDMLDLLRTIEYYRNSDTSWQKVLEAKKAYCAYKGKVPIG